jgi:hypothetical protein
VRLRSLFAEYRVGVDISQTAVHAVEAIVNRSEKLRCNPSIRTPRATKSN